MFVLQAAFSHDKDNRPCYIAGAMSTPYLKQADVYATRAAAELEADKIFPAAKIVELADIA